MRSKKNETNTYSMFHLMVFHLQRWSKEPLHVISNDIDHDNDQRTREEAKEPENTQFICDVRNIVISIGTNSN